MVAKLSIINVKVLDSSNIDVTFSETLTPSLITSNVTIVTDTIGAPDSEVLKVKVNGNMLSILCQPLTPLASYFVVFQSVPLHPFQSLHGEAVIPEDGITNKYGIVAPLDSNNPIKNYLGAFYKDNIYNLDDENTLVNKYIQSLAVVLSRALYDIKQVKNENYLSFTTTDERKIRGSGPFDRLSEESAYEISRVGRTPTGFNAKNTFPFVNFPTYPVTLQRKSNVDILTPNTLAEPGFFDVNNLTVNLNSSPVTRITSIVFTLNTITPVYVYDIEHYGYQIKDSRYAQDYGFTYLQLDDNQIRLSDKVLLDPLFDLTQIISVEVQYESKNLGVVIDPASVVVYASQVSPREVLPPIINVFNLSHAPIIDGSNNVPTLGGATFEDPNSNIGLPHPAFKFEIPFRFDALPSTPGQYAVDYATGTVYVYGENLNNDGTGPFPPLATYRYRLIYQSEIDYTYDNDFRDLVALPTGSLVDNIGNIAFSYEEVLVPGVDYEASLHSEALTERIDNNLVAFNVLKVKNGPITNVFRVYNETSGEIYTINRWSDDKIYFRYNTPPRVLERIRERAVFAPISNEMLFVHTTLVNTATLRIFQVFLNSNKITASSEDGIAAFLNTSLSFSDANVFTRERWFNSDFSEAVNIDRLIDIGDYMVDYRNGRVYCAVSNTQGLDIGTASYKNSDIVPEFTHLISVDDIYYQISPLNVKNKLFSFTSFDEGVISPETLELVDEKYLNGFVGAPYQIYNNSVGTFSGTSFISGVTNEVKLVRGLYEYEDLIGSTNPFNFAQTCVSSGFNITVGSYTKQVFDTVQYDGSDYYVNINENIPYLSSSITYSFSIIRVSDSAQLWDNSGVVTAGAPVKLVLSGVNSPMIGDQVKIVYSFTINDLSRVVVDYNKGDYYVDYTYLADEIIISYEYGDNVLDFRHNTNLPADTTYFVTYKAGALRDALLKNFGTLVNVPELANFDIDFNRERYRDALMAALTSFIQGPTVAAIKNIGKTISHIEPQVIEDAFINWSLGSSVLVPEGLDTTGSFESEPVKHGTGILVNQPGQTVTFPASSNIRLEEGTFETWIKNKWDGLDNDARLTFTILKDGYAIPSNEVFVGSGEYHPEINLGKFTIHKNDNALGTPNTNKDGVYIYYDKDPSDRFYRWYFRIIDGYVFPNSSTYRVTINSDGKFYDNKSLTQPKPSNLSIFSGTNHQTFTLTGGSFGLNEGVTFVSDLEHYLLDFGKDKNHSRLSIFKDVSGYMNFRVYDKNGVSFLVSADISTWRFNEVHHVAASWKLNTVNGRDEMHLFLDGFEVPNIIRYGQQLQPYLHEKFRTVDPEEIVGLTARDIVGSVDLQTVSGSSTVTSSLNFGTYQIFPGDIITIDEVGFSPSGYSISSISGQSLVLGTPMPLTLTNGRFSINRTQFTVVSEIDTAPNIAVATVPTFIVGTDGYGTLGSNVVSSLITDFTVANVLPGYLIRINDPALALVYTILQVSGNSLIINASLPANLPATAFEIYSDEETEIPGVRAIRPSYSITKDGYYNNILTISNNVYAGNLILVRTLGLNFRKVRKTYYVWSDGLENILMTQLPPPISLDEANITKVILRSTFVGPSNSTLTLGTFVSNNFATYPSVTSQDGRTLSVTVSGTNADFSTPVAVTVNGIVGVSAISETINFTDYGILDTVNKFITVNYVQVNAKPTNVLKNAVVVEVKEKYAITRAEDSSLAPVVRYSYPIGGGGSLYDDGYQSVRDDNFLFSGLDVNNYLVIHSPISVAGFYRITGFSEDRKSLSIESTLQAPTQPLASFTNGVYTILNVNEYRSGLQNGYFTFENNVLPSQGYYLHHGLYELEYKTYTSIRMDASNEFAYLGTDFHGHLPLNGTIDQLKIYSVMLTDTRVGETIPSNQRSITKDFNSLKALRGDINTLMLVGLDEFPLTNAAKYYTNTNTDKRHFQSSVVINENFGNSLVITDKPIIVENTGILNTRKEGSVEFWVNPLFDSTNDPVDRFYFDAYGAKIEEAVSVNNVAVKLSGPASRILSVQLKAGDPRIDYFMGGKIEIDTQHAIQENATSISNSHVIATKSILQVISVKIVGDKTGIDYFSGGSIGSDKLTIYLGKLLPGSSLPLIVTYQTTENKNVNLNTQVIRLNRKLPNQNSHVVVKYIPQGLQGDRIAIYKDKLGGINFGISASGTDFVVRAPTRWARNTWHRVKATYKINGELGADEMRLFIDGYQFSNIVYGSNLIFGKSPVIYGASYPGFSGTDGYNFVQSIKFKDSINDLYIGTQHTGENAIFALLDNFRISTVSRPLYAPYGEPLDVNYSTNLSTVFPVTEDLFTTYLMNFDKLVLLNDNFSILKNRKTGLFDFSVNILDSFGIVNSSIKVQEVLEKLIKVLKPANSRVFIQYIR